MTEKYTVRFQPRCVNSSSWLFRCCKDGEGRLVCHPGSCLVNPRLQDTPRCSRYSRSVSPIRLPPAESKVRFRTNNQRALPIRRTRHKGCRIPSPRTPHPSKKDLRECDAKTMMVLQLVRLTQNFQQISTTTQGWRILNGGSECRKLCGVFVAYPAVRPGARTKKNLRSAPCAWHYR